MSGMEYMGIMLNSGYQQIFRDSKTGGSSSSNQKSLEPIFQAFAVVVSICTVLQTLYEAYSLYRVIQAAKIHQRRYGIGETENTTGIWLLRQVASSALRLLYWMLAIAVFDLVEYCVSGSVGSWWHGLVTLAIIIVFVGYWLVCKRAEKNAARKLDVEAGLAGGDMQELVSI